MKKGLTPLEKDFLTGLTTFELLAAIVSIIMTIGGIALIFMQWSKPVDQPREIIEGVYANARYALDYLEEDLHNMIAFDGRQAFLTSNGWYEFNAADGSLLTPPSRTGPSEGVVSPQCYVHSGFAPGTGGTGYAPADELEFRTIISLDDEPRPIKVIYKLAAWETILAAGGSLDPELRRWTRTMKDKRPIFMFVRELWIYNSLSEQYEFFKRQELHHYVLGFNLEYFANNTEFLQLDTPSNLNIYFRGSPCPNYSSSRNSTCPDVYDPLGDGDPDKNNNGINDDIEGHNDTRSATYGTPHRITHLRVTLQVLGGEGHERTHTRVIWIPVN